jgi:hydroxymethylbilane synthase
MVLSIKVAARGSALSRAQVEEVQRELPSHVKLDPIWIATTGDQNQAVSLRDLDKTDFFTKEIDALQLAGGCRIAIHSAKDLPDPLAKGLKLVALTKGVDPSDALVFHELPLHAKIGTSSRRREQMLAELRSDLRGVDIRGTIEQRLALLDAGQVDGVIIAEAALIRLGLTHRKRMRLPGEPAPLQGRLAILAREDDDEMQTLFAPLHV